MRVGVVGASGYIGGELLRLVLNHPKFELTCATSRKYAGEYIYRVHPNLRGLTELQFSERNFDRVSGSCDLIFTSVPHGSAVKVIPDYIPTGLRIVDLSADFRLKNPEDYKKWYGFDHPHPELLDKFVYGIPELKRDLLRSATLVSSPGCMAVTSILALAPLVRNGSIDLDHIVVDAKIGSSGAGVKPDVSTIHSERYGVVRPYKPVGHRHTAEIEQELSLIAGQEVRVSMSPHAVNIVRGILCTCQVFPTSDLTVSDVWKAYRSAYQGEPFIRLIKDKQGLYRYPDPKMVIGSNFCDIGFEHDAWAKRLVVMAATDNLVKGGAGSAIQAANIMLGLDETLGLRAASLHPV